jgi:hypothetical protein
MNWFMFPVSILVATAAMLSGVGGHALLIPIFLIAFPVTGPEYPLTTATAIGAARGAPPQKCSEMSRCPDEQLAMSSAWSRVNLLCWRTPMVSRIVDS